MNQWIGGLITFAFGCFTGWLITYIWARKSIRNSLRRTQEMLHEDIEKAKKWLRDKLS